MSSTPVYCEPYCIEKGFNFEVHHVAYEKDAPYSCALHFHEVHEIIVFENIEGHFYYSKGESLLKDGDIVFTPALETHYFEVSPAAKSWYIIQFLPEMLNSEGLNQARERFMSASQYRFPPKDQRRLRRLVKWLEESYRENPFGEKSQALLKLLLIWISDSAEAIQPKSKTGAINPRISAKLKPVLDRFKDNDSVDLSLNAAAELCHLSPSYFSRVFKAIYRYNYSEYVLQHKLHRAARQLGQSGKNITTISYELNFSSPSHFIAQFKRYFGQTPKQYQQDLLVKAKAANTHL